MDVLLPVMNGGEVGYIYSQSLKSSMCSSMCSRGRGVAEGEKTEQCVMEMEQE